MSDGPGTETCPLAGRRIVVTRAAAQADDLLAQLRALGAEPLACPAIAITAPTDFAALDAALGAIADYDWVIFTSVNGVSAVLDRLAVQGRAPSALAGPRIAAIGPGTAGALAAAGLPPAFVPGRFVTEALVAEIGDVAGRRVLLPRADIARPALALGLRARGAFVDEITAYCTVPAELPTGIAAALRAGQVDAITFTSSSTVRYFLSALAPAGVTVTGLQGPERPAVVCIGPITAATARARGLPVDAVAAEYTIPGLVAALVRWFAAAPAPERI